MLLVVIPLGFALSLSGHLAFSVPLHQAFLLGAVLGLLALVDALFLNPPAESPPDDSSSD